VIASTQPNPTSLPIQAGDLLGVRNTNNSDQLGLLTAPASVAPAFLPALVDGAPPRSPGNGTGEFGIQAEVRYCKVPKVRGLKLAKAKKKLGKADCASKIRGKDKKKGKDKSVRSQDAAPGTFISDTQKIGLKLGDKSKGEKK
jgi:PASTA domain